MLTMIIGMVLWVDAHMFKRLLPGSRERLNKRIGAGPARGLMSVVILLSVVLMVMGYRAAPVTQIYAPVAGMGHLNNLLMIFAVILIGMGKSKGHMGTWLRHPMLTGIIVWAVAHLLVNGDLASIILFGGMAVWAFLQMMLINSRETWQRPTAGPVSGDIKLLIISAVVFIVIVSIHMALGYNPFLGSY